MESGQSCRGELWGVKAEISGARKVFKVVDGKAQPHYHEKLGKLKWDWETLKEELLRMRKDGAPSTPEPVVPSPQTTLRWKEPAVPTGPGTLKVSLQIALKDLLPWGVPETLGYTKNPPSGEANIQACRRGIWRSSSSRKEHNRPRRGSIRRTPGTFLAKVQQAKEGKMEAKRSSETIGPSTKSKEEGIIKSR